MSNSGKKAVVADSWEDEVEDISAPEEPTPRFLKLTSTPTPSVAAPPPTCNCAANGRTSDGHGTPTSSQDPASAKRPEKTDSVARRMIAAGLGLRAPKQTEEQKAYQKSIREQEKKRKEQLKEEEERQREMAEKAKAAIWED